MFLVVGIAPLVAPLVGSQFLRVTAWRGSVVLLVGFGLALTALASLRLPETLPPERRRPATLHATGTTFARLLSSPVFLGYAAPIACTVGMFVASLSSVPFVIQDVYGRSAQTFAAMFFAISLVMMVISQLNARLVQTIDPARLLVGGAAVQVVGAASVLAFGDRGLWTFFACLAVALPWWGFVVANATALAMRDYAAVAGTAAALLGVAQYGFSALAAPLTGLGGRGSVHALGVVLTALATVSCVSAFLTVAADRRRAAHAADHGR
jgi:DHA1 family bicyclomycin/chloramphenicol resistance-like MFS transporter